MHTLLSKQWYKKKTNNKNVLSDSSGYGGDAIASYNLLSQSTHNT